MVHVSVKLDVVSQPFKLWGNVRGSTRQTENIQMKFLGVFVYAQNVIKAFLRYVTSCVTESLEIKFFV